MNPLRRETPVAWADAALAEPLALLDDHAHLERKAATNALDLFARRAEPRWCATLAAIARDESDLLARVVRLLARRGAAPSPTHRNDYALALRGLVRLGRGPEELLDRLLVSALIELRSCERFVLLAERARDDELRALYAGLRASEDGHWRAFVDLARLAAGAGAAEARWDALLAAEAEVCAAQAPGPRMHAGAP